MCAIFYTHQTSGACAGVCACDRMHQIEKTAVIANMKQKTWRIYFRSEVCARCGWFSIFVKAFVVEFVICYCVEAFISFFRCIKSLENFSQVPTVNFMQWK